MNRKIYKIGDETLRKISNPVTKFNDIRLNMLLRDMAETMYKANGIGLAAPQIGITRRIAVVDVSEERNELLELINPEIIEKSGMCQMQEGCLSVPARQGVVSRPEKITLKYQTRKGEEKLLQADGILARCIQHELDHLDGILYVDKMEYELDEKGERI